MIKLLNLYVAFVTAFIPLYSAKNIPIFIQKPLHPLIRLIVPSALSLHLCSNMVTFKKFIIIWRSETTDMERHVNRKLFLLGFLILTIVFIGLYHGFIFGGQMYAYTDVGADTVDQYLPVTVFETNTIKNTSNGTYSLNYALGKYCDGYLLKYLNPVELPLLIFGENNLHIGIMVSTYVTYLFIFLFAFLFLKRILKDEKIALICALMWTFCGYTVLWGQHYMFQKSMLFATVAIYGFQLFLDGGKKRYLAIPAVAALAANSYYHLYMVCFFFLIYGFAYLRFQGNSFLQIIKKAGIFILYMLPALCIAGFYLIPAMAEFTGSSRTGALSSPITAEPLIYSPIYLGTYLARLFSPDLFQTGDLFLGPSNYYECAILSVSILFSYSLIYLLQRKNWKKVLCLTLIGIFCLCSPIFSRIIVFSSTTQRWTFLLSFAQVIAIGFALVDVFHCDDEKLRKKLLLRTALITDALLILVGLGLYMVHLFVGGWLLKFSALRIVIFTAIVYHVAFLAITKKHLAYYVLMCVVALEMVIGNYACVNDRSTPTVQQWYESMYYDGTAEVVDWIEDQDDSLYRINKTYTSGYHTDSLIQGYNGLGTYHSLNSGYLVNLARSYGYPDAGNRIRFNGHDPLANNMLGVKYVIAETGTYMNPRYYKQVFHDQEHEVYENLYWLGFGYQYPIQSISPLPAGSTALEKTLLLSGSYSITGEAGNDGPVSGTKSIDLLSHLSSSEGCDTAMDDALQVTGTDQTMTLYFDIPEIEKGWIVAGIEVQMNAANGSLMRLYAAGDLYDFKECGYHGAYYGAGEGVYYVNHYALDVPSELKLDLSYTKQNISISSLKLILVNEQQLQTSLRNLQDTCIRSLEQEGNSFRGSVTNAGDSTNMLCIPLIYDPHWHASIDGQPVQVTNINGGLVGIEITSGSHSIELEYVNHTYQLGILVSVISVIAYCSAMVILCRRSKKHTQN